MPLSSQLFSIGRSRLRSSSLSATFAPRPTLARRRIVLIAFAGSQRGRGLIIIGRFCSIGFFGLLAVLQRGEDPAIRRPHDIELSALLPLVRQCDIQRSMSDSGLRSTSLGTAISVDPKVCSVLVSLAYSCRSHGHWAGHLETLCQ